MLRRILASIRKRTYCRMQSARKTKTTEREYLENRVSELGPWFHNYQIATNFWTNPQGTGPGANYPDWRWRAVQPLLPEISGKTCLDVGCSSGFFSLKLKELGAAHVLGIDAGEQQKAIDQAKFAADTLQLDVEFRTLSVYDLRQLERQFDVVLFMGVFYHLRHPLLALEAIRTVCRETLIVQTITTEHKRAANEMERTETENVGFRSPVLTDERFPAIRFVEGALDGDVTCWFIPNVQALAAMLRSSGFTIEETIFPTEREAIMRCSVRWR